MAWADSAASRLRAGSSRAETPEHRGGQAHTARTRRDAMVQRERARGDERPMNAIRRCPRVAMRGPHRDRVDSAGMQPGKRDGTDRPDERNETASCQFGARNARTGPGVRTPAPPRARCSPTARQRAGGKVPKQLDEPIRPTRTGQADAPEIAGDRAPAAGWALVRSETAGSAVRGDASPARWVSAERCLPDRHVSTVREESHGINFERHPRSARWTARPGSSRKSRSL